MQHRTFHYKNPRYLNDLITFIEGTNCKLSASLLPDVPELLDAALEGNFPDIPELDGAVTKDGKKLRGEVLDAIRLLFLCEKHGISPFHTLYFDYGLRQHNEPEIRYEGPRFGPAVYSEPYRTCSLPFHFSQGKKWWAIRFEEFLGSENIGNAKIAIADFIKQGYVVTSIHTRLNPSVKSSGHYFSYEKFDGEMFASNGKVEIYGNIPDDFELPKKPKQLPKPIGLLESALSGL